MPEPTESALLAAYAAVAARRTQFDSLLWQVPVLQAFLFTIALGQGSDAWARIISSILSLTIAIISILLMARHRQAELYDSEWLERVEHEVLNLGPRGAHGSAFRRGRDQQRLAAGRIGRLIPLRPMFGVWVAGLALFGFSAFVVIIRTLVIL